MTDKPENPLLLRRALLESQHALRSRLGRAPSPLEIVRHAYEYAQATLEELPDREFGLRFGRQPFGGDRRGVACISAPNVSTSEEVLGAILKILRSRFPASKFREALTARYRSVEQRMLRAGVFVAAAKAFNEWMPTPRPQSAAA